MLMIPLLLILLSKLIIKGQQQKSHKNNTVRAARVLLTAFFTAGSDTILESRAGSLLSRTTVACYHTIVEAVAAPGVSDLIPDDPVNALL
jgi:hypothetical protein